MSLERLYPPPDTTAPNSYNLNTGKVNGKLASLLGHSTGFTIHPHAGAGPICQGGHSQSSAGPMPTGFTVVDVFKYAVANLVTEATGVTITLLDNPTVLGIPALAPTGVKVDLLLKPAIATRILVATGLTVFLLLKLTVATFAITATGVSRAFEDIKHVAVLVTTATGETLASKDNCAMPVGLPDLEPTGVTVVLLLRFTIAIRVLVATGVTVALLLRFTMPVGLPDLEPTGKTTALLDSGTDTNLVTIATGATLALLDSETVTNLVTTATGEADALELKPIERVCAFVVLGLRLVLELAVTDGCFTTDATGETLALDLSRTTAAYTGVIRVFEDMETLPITVLAGGFIVTLAELLADTVPVLVPGETPNATPNTPNLGPPRRPASGVAIY